MSKSEIPEWMKQKFEELWSSLLKKPRGVIIKSTRKDVAQLFFYAGMSAMLERAVAKEELQQILARLTSLEDGMIAGQSKSELSKIADDLTELLTLQVARISDAAIITKAIPEKEE